MSHEVLGDRFFSDRSQPAWHHIMKAGIEDRDYTAAEAYDLIGRYDVRLEPLQTVRKRRDTSEHIAIPERVILRQPLPEDPEPRSFGVVGGDYVLVTPDQVVDMWDAIIKRPVRTAITLRDGKLFVLSCEMKPFAVRGEHVDNYAVVGNWMSGTDASFAMTTSVCPVCMNTVRWGQSVAGELQRFVHDANVHDRMAGWMRGLVERLEVRLPELQAKAEAMAEYRLRQPNEEVRFVLEAAYPVPAEPKPDNLMPDLWNEKRYKKYEAETQAMTDRRVTAFSLFRGQGTGMRTSARLGTAWGLYQAVVETEDYRKGSSGDGLTSSLLIGDRAVTKGKAFDAAFTVATHTGELVPA